MDIYKVFAKGYGFLNIACLMMRHFACHYMFMNIVTWTLLHCRGIRTVLELSGFGMCGNGKFRAWLVYWIVCCSRSQCDLRRGFAASRLLILGGPVLLGQDVSLVWIVVCCQVAVFATGQSLVLRSPTVCVCVCVFVFMSEGDQVRQ